MNKKRKICVVTGTRAEYGIMSRLMKSLKDDPKVELQVIATNMHLSPEFGMTITEIEGDGIRVDKRVEMLLSSDSNVGIVKSMGLELIGMADALEELDPDLVVLLGDRYEMLSVASASLIMGLPVAHLYGGEITEGAYDDSIRHAITKLAYLHFTSTEEYASHVIQMGEDPERVFCVGALGADNIKKNEVMALQELEESLGMDLGDNFIVVTYHPVTTEVGDAEKQINNLIKSLDKIKKEHKCLITLPNSDSDGRVITTQLMNWVKENREYACVVTSLGRRRYYSALAHCKAVVGNSSSGLCEAPSFKVPTLNIGNRQRGRTQGNTVINCDTTEEGIDAGLEKILASDFTEYVKQNGENPYSKENTLEEIHKILVDYPLPKNLTKHFYVLNENLNK